MSRSVLRFEDFILPLVASDTSSRASQASLLGSLSPAVTFKGYLVDEPVLLGATDTWLSEQKEELRRASSRVAHFVTLASQSEWAQRVRYLNQVETCLNAMASLNDVPLRFDSQAPHNLMDAVLRDQLKKIQRRMNYFLVGSGSLVFLLSLSGSALALALIKSGELSSVLSHAMGGIGSPASVVIVALLITLVVAGITVGAIYGYQRPRMNRTKELLNQGQDSLDVDTAKEVYVEAALKGQRLSLKYLAREYGDHITEELKSEASALVMKQTIATIDAENAAIDASGELDEKASSSPIESFLKAYCEAWENGDEKQLSGYEEKHSEKLHAFFATEGERVYEGLIRTGKLSLMQHFESLAGESVMSSILKKEMERANDCPFKGVYVSAYESRQPAVFERVDQLASKYATPKEDQTISAFLSTDAFPHYRNTLYHQAVKENNIGMADCIGSCMEKRKVFTTRHVINAYQSLVLDCDHPNSLRDYEKAHEKSIKQAVAYLIKNGRTLGDHVGDARRGLFFRHVEEVFGAYSKEICAKAHQWVKPWMKNAIIEPSQRYRQLAYMGLFEEMKGMETAGFNPELVDIQAIYKEMYSCFLPVKDRFNMLIHLNKNVRTLVGGDLASLTLPRIDWILKWRYDDNYLAFIKSINDISPDYLDSILFEKPDTMYLGAGQCTYKDWPIDIVYREALLRENFKLIDYIMKKARECPAKLQGHVLRTFSWDEGKFTQQKRNSDNIVMTARHGCLKALDHEFNRGCKSKMSIDYRLLRCWCLLVRRDRDDAVKYFDGIKEFEFTEVFSNEYLTQYLAGALKSAVKAGDSGFFCHVFKKLTADHFVKICKEWRESRHDECYNLAKTIASSSRAGMSFLKGLLASLDSFDDDTSYAILDRFVSDFQCFDEEARRFLLSHEDFYILAAAHSTERDDTVGRCANKKIQGLRDSRDFLDKPEEFDVSEKEARLCVATLGYLIKLNDPEDIEAITFLISIPSVSKRLYQPLNKAQRYNHLLYLANDLGNKHARDALLTVSSVRTLVVKMAENPVRGLREGLTEEERSTIRALTNNPDSSVTPPTKDELVLQGRLDNEYERELNDRGVDSLIHELHREMIALYKKDPALDADGHSLPLTYAEFEALKLKDEKRKQALIAYHKHPDHSAYRYLLSPNPFIDPSAPHARHAFNGDAIAAEYECEKRHIALLYLMMTDEAFQKGRPALKEEFLNAVADCLYETNRAHNKDRHILKEVNGKTVQVLHHFVEEGDRPSCLAGVWRQLFQCHKYLALRMEHPICVMPEKTISLEEEFKKCIRQHFVKCFEEKNSEALKEAVLLYFDDCDLDDLSDEQKELLRSTNVTDTQIDRMIAELYLTYGQAFTVESILAFRSLFKTEGKHEHLHILQYYNEAKIEKIMIPPSEEDGPQAQAS